MKRIVPAVLLVSAVAVLLVVRGAAAPVDAALAKPAAAAKTYSIDSVHSSLVFRIRFAGLCDFWGRFNDFSGSYVIDEAAPENMKFEITAQAASVDTGNDRRDGHLRSPDFFSAKEHPEMKFSSTAVKKTGDDVYEVTGNLTLRGVTQEVTAQVRYGGRAEGRRGERTGLDGTVTIRRADFGIEFSPDRLGPDVTIQMGLTGVEES